MPFTVTSNVHVGRDSRGTARHVVHLQEPYAPAGAAALTPRSLAGAYVQDIAELYELDSEWLRTIAETTGHTLKREGSQLRFRESKRLLNTTIVAYQQTYLGLPVWGAHLDVRLHDAPTRVTSSTSFVHHDVDAKPPSKGARFLPGKAATAALLRRLVAAAKGRIVKFTDERLIVYRYEAETRVDPESRPAAPDDVVRTTRRRSARQTESHRVPVPTLPLPDVPKTIAEGRHYVVNEVLFTTALGPWRQLHWRAFVEVQTGAVLYLRALVAHAFGNVFSADPVSATGNAALTPTSPAATLDPLTSVVTLPGLTAPPAGDPQVLTGEYVQVGELSGPAVVAPTAALPAGNFSRSCTTDDFGAVNVYYTCDLFFRTMQAMGIDVATYFGDTTFPLTVDHRDASLGTVNARGYGNATGDGAGGMGFNFLDAASAITISAEPRIAWHEFGHELLFEHVGGPNFGFAHSAGDSLGVIMLDPDSQAPDRFLTFPFCPTIVRRHDRPVSGGWGWFGSQWDSQYNGEQVLSTTLFRLYRSTGGDAADVAQRRLAARYTCYLIIQGCGALTATTSDPDVYASAMMEADLGTPDFESIAGGAVHKVVRWAFEKQGLYRAAGAPTTDEGQPPDVDVYIDDGRAGEYPVPGQLLEHDGDLEPPLQRRLGHRSRPRDAHRRPGELPVRSRAEPRHADGDRHHRACVPLRAGDGAGVAGRLAGIADRRDRRRRHHGRRRCDRRSVRVDAGSDRPRMPARNGLRRGGQGEHRSGVDVAGSRGTHSPLAPRAVRQQHRAAQRRARAGRWRRRRTARGVRTAAILGAQSPAPAPAYRAAGGAPGGPVQARLRAAVSQRRRPIVHARPARQPRGGDAADPRERFRRR